MPHVAFKRITSRAVRAAGWSLLFLFAGCSAHSPSEPTPAAKAGQRQEFRVGEVGGGGPGCVPSDCFDVVVAVAASGGTLTLNCLNVAPPPGLRLVSCNVVNATGRLAGLAAVGIYTDPRTGLTVVSDPFGLIDRTLRVHLLLGRRLPDGNQIFPSEGDLPAIVQLMNRGACTRGEVIVKLSFSGTLTYLGNVTGSMTGTCRG